MSRTVVEETNLSRAINAIAVTLNDQKVEQFEAERVQELATGAMGGEKQLIAYGSGSSGELRDGSIDGEPVARFTYENGEWSATRLPEERKSDALQEKEQKREKQKKVEYQRPLLGRLAIWKKKASGG